MTVLARRWKRTRGNKTKIVHGADINGSENPWIGKLLGDYRSRANDELEYGFVAVAYLLEEYGDQALEEVAEMDKEDREQYVKNIEIRLSDDDDEEPDPRDGLDLDN